MTRRGWFAIAGLVLGVTWLVYAAIMHPGRHPAPPPEQLPAPSHARAPDEHDFDQESEPGMAFFPPGEWWAATPGWTVLIRRHRAASRVALATEGAEAVGSVELVGPNRIVVTVPLAHADQVGTWTFRAPEEPYGHDGKVPESPADDVIDRFAVDAIEGFGAEEAPFTLFKADLHDPAIGCPDRNEVFRRLRALLDRAEGKPH